VQEQRVRSQDGKHEFIVLMTGPLDTQPETNSRVLELEGEGYEVFLTPGTHVEAEMGAHPRKFVFHKGA
jgi:hypothetical protein